MSGPWKICITERERTVFETELAGTVELGRQREREKEPFAYQKEGERSRIVIARLNENAVSRRHVLVEPLANNKVRLTNLSEKLPVLVTGRGEMRPGSAWDVDLPAEVSVGTKSIRVQETESSWELAGSELYTLEMPPPVPGSAAAGASPFPTLSRPAVDGVQLEEILRYLQTTMGVLHCAASSLEFFDKAAQAVVELAGMDSGRVVLLERGKWKVHAVQLAPHRAADPDWDPSQSILGRLLQDKRSFWLEPSSAQKAESLVGVKAVVAAPILDRHGELIGALYGDVWKQTPLNPPRPVMRLQTMLVELLASGVAAALARVEQEQAALRARVQFEQFFTAELSRHLAARPDLLQGRDAEVTLLFCDIRGFARISGRLGPAGTVEWIKAVLGALSDCVLDHQGVLVDYIGDELVAMWGAPEEQTDHAALACRAALAMLECLPGLNERWQTTTQEPLRLGIGINTGAARVGNIGTHRKFKYGPLGTAVNLASRVQGATKYLKTSLVVTEATHARLGEGFASRRLGKVRMVNIEEPVSLYEVVTPGQPDWPLLQQKYEEALTEFERGNYVHTAQTLGALITEHPDDGPLLVLLARAVNAVVEEPAALDVVWELPGK